MSKLKFISLDKLLEMYTNREEFKVLESMSPGYFSQGHLPGAIHNQLSNSDFII